MHEQTRHAPWAEQLLKVVILAAALWGVHLLYRTVVAPEPLAAQQTMDCANCHTTGENHCKTCHDPAGGGLPALEWDQKPVCMFWPGDQPCRTVSWQTCSGFEVVVRIFTGSLENCRTITEEWHWT